MIEKSEKDSREGLLINITGNGKGKTTSALGTCMRALGWGWQVSIIQFIKNKQENGEKRFAATIAENLEMVQCGLGLTHNSRASDAQHIEAARNAWEKAKSHLRAGKADLMVFDELNIVLKLGWLDVDDVINALRKRPKRVHVIITGRNAPDKLIAASDLVSEIKEIKHPYKSGIKARKGIEY
ncbi:MAG: cob(I)yrinic acid a,c-diamide adenosyltransferase [Victivallaceae bacterium]|nr:cob(I)yrinic acid a,c-diamide adenosyltransferase [Victivallaceae bacterium]